MKSLFAFIINLILMFNLICGGIVYADTENNTVSAQLEIGDYFTFGKYNDEPIIWRYAADDTNGKLVVSDRILCRKAFGKSNFWEESFIRSWLNSSASEDEVQWDFDGIIDSSLETYKNEKGFLHESNFSQSERKLLKTVTQWTMLSQNQLDLATNAFDKPYDAFKVFVPGNPRDGGRYELYEMQEIPEIYFGAAHETTDTIFLLDEMQLYHMWCNFGKNNQALQAMGVSSNKWYDKSYFLRTPLSKESTMTMRIIYGKYGYGAAYIGGSGIRPAFYLNEENAQILSGSGTAEDPYVMDGKADENDSGITVFCNGSEISFDRYPFLESDRVMVPMRMIFEALGADVQWNEQEQSVTATCGADTVKMQIGNTEIWKNDVVIESDVAPRLIGDRTFVPLRVVSESLGASVEWIEEEKKVVITK